MSCSGLYVVCRYDDDSIEFYSVYLKTRHLADVLPFLSVLRPDERIRQANKAVAETACRHAALVVCCGQISGLGQHLHQGRQVPVLQLALGLLHILLGNIEQMQDRCPGFIGARCTEDVACALKSKEITTVGRWHRYKS